MLVVSEVCAGDMVLEGLEKEARVFCGLIRSRCRRGRGGKDAVEAADEWQLPGGGSGVVQELIVLVVE